MHQSIYTWQKTSKIEATQGSRPHTFVHWVGFAPAAPRRAWIHVFCLQNRKGQSMCHRCMIYIIVYCSHCICFANLRIHLRAITLMTRTDYSLVSHLISWKQSENIYTNYKLISRNPILSRLSFQWKRVPASLIYRVLFAVTVTNQAVLILYT